MAVRIQFRRGTSSEWSSANPVLAEGELGFESDTKIIKFGDGATAWDSLQVAAAGDITAVIAGPGLEGGATSGVAELSINTSFVVTADSIDAPGDLIVGAGPDTYARLPVGANGSVLVADSTQSVGVRWAAASSSSGAVVPTGTILPFAGIAPSGVELPGGFFLCDGQPIPRAQYADLFAVISDRYGAGNGSSTFNVPDLRERVPVGLKAGDTNFGTLAVKYGDQSINLTSAHVPKHEHGITFTGNGTHDHLNQSTSNESPQHSHGVSVGSAGSAHKHVLKMSSIQASANGFYSSVGLSNTISQETEDGGGSHSHSSGSTSGGAHGHSFSISSSGTHDHDATITNTLSTSVPLSLVQPSLVVNYIIKT